MSDKSKFERLKKEVIRRITQYADSSDDLYSGISSEDMQLYTRILTYYSKLISNYWRIKLMVDGMESELADLTEKLRVYKVIRNNMLDMVRGNFAEQEVDEFDKVTQMLESGDVDNVEKFLASFNTGIENDAKN